MDFIFDLLRLAPQSHGCTYFVRSVAHGPPKNGLIPSTRCWPTWTSFVPSRVFLQWSEPAVTFPLFHQSKKRRSKSCLCLKKKTNYLFSMNSRKRDILSIKTGVKATVQRAIPTFGSSFDKLNFTVIIQKRLLFANSWLSLGNSRCILRRSGIHSSRCMKFLFFVFRIWQNFGIEISSSRIQVSMRASEPFSEEERRWIILLSH